MITLIDFGSQTAHLIKRRLNRFGVKVEFIEPSKATLKYFIKRKPKGIILSGGPAGVYEKNSPKISAKIFDLKVPILGICYGLQFLSFVLGGKVIPGNKEYGPERLIIKRQDILFDGISRKIFTVWMSHGDEVTRLPKGFSYLAITKKVKAGAIVCRKKKIWGIQFHPEVSHTDFGNTILRNFVEKICGEEIMESTLDVKTIIQKTRKKIDSLGKDTYVVGAVSGGVDSTVAAMITSLAIGKRFIPVYCDNGLMRLGTKERVRDIFRNSLKINPIILDCREEFFAKLKGVISPEQKRKIIGKLYIDLFKKEIKKIRNARFLLQGTIYSDVIESGKSASGGKNSRVIKSHHNVGGLPKNLNLKIIEPLRKLYKDDVRELARQLGLSKDIIWTQPYPGPGLAIRIIGEVTKERAKKYLKVDKIMNDILKRNGWYEKVFQSFPILTGINSTSVKGDRRVYAEVIALRIYQSSDIMTVGPAKISYPILQEMVSAIIKRTKKVSRVVYDITTKPPATMEWE